MQPVALPQVPRQIPEVMWYRRGWFQAVVAGLLPFSAISIELHYIFASVWGRKVYTLFGILFLAFVLLFIVTSFVVIALTYFQLAVEDYRWYVVGCVAVPRPHHRCSPEEGTLCCCRRVLCRSDCVPVSVEGSRVSVAVSCGRFGVRGVQVVALIC